MYIHAKIHPDMRLPVNVGDGNIHYKAAMSATTKQYQEMCIKGMCIGYTQVLWDSWYYGTSMLTNMEVSSLGVIVLYLIRTITY